MAEQLAMRRSDLLWQLVLVTALYPSERAFDRTLSQLERANVALPRSRSSGGAFVAWSSTPLSMPP